MKSYRTYALALGVLFAAFVAVEYYRPKPISWQETFSNKDKIPYGTYVLYEVLPDLFKNQPVSMVRLPVVNQVEEKEAQKKDSGATKVNYVFVNSEMKLGSQDLQALLRFAGRGGQVFISAHRFPSRLEKALGVKTRFSKKTKQDSLGLVFTHPQLANNKPVYYAWEKVDNTITLDSSAFKTTVLGRNTAGDTNFVQVHYGKGSFYLSSVPLAFTNYYVISPQESTYAAQALSHLPVAPVWWDEYQKQGPVGENSVFRVLLEHEALTWAYYIALGSLLLFVLFESKRTQRIIPILEKPRNTTLEFVKVIGSLYFNHRDHHVIAEKKVNYFLEYLRLHYFEATSTLDQDLETRIAHKSGVEEKEIAELFRIIRHVKSSDSLQEQILWQLNKKLESFYRQASR
ncbi:hypothetical protein TH63_15530 [Rufibacter radiotolerans]|uniref:DUF4350 domain-containing protein n=1 Tax=Rufibacter radiotolerans TaxID=1379910 RepID=A0A0H4VRY3_9BACT|nr:DUF4350 domain-containing protein [Rufibacter radiotolerans]AKQ46712.1 hypothetical protein TH63_15530 [Rufibacter radiotolerans]